MIFQNSLRAFCITMISGLWMRAQAELFTAVSDIEPLLNTHKSVIDTLEDYIDKDESRLAGLKKYLNRYKKEHILAMDDISDYLGNPINAFTLIKRLTKDLDYIQNILNSTDNVKNIASENPDVMYPTTEDLTGTVQGLTRLQNTYLLDIGELAEGRLIGKISRGTKHPAISIPMTASDCYELGLTLYNEKDYQNSLQWMTESLRKLKSGDDLCNVSEAEVLEYISLNQYMLGDVKAALEWTRNLLILDPKHPRASEKLVDYQKAVDEQELEITRRGGGAANEEKDNLQTLVPVKNDTTARYEALCRGDIDIPREMEKKLKCSYLTKNNSFLKLAPIKMEQVYLEPDVFIFHEVISDDEIQHVKSMAKPRFARACVNDLNSGKAVPSSIRISKSAWLCDLESEVVARVTRRTADFTGYAMDTAECLQVANYGIGGFYVPHFDYGAAGATGQRIVTVLFYMSDVAQGGATVFTELGLTVFPIKNSALVWNNLLPSGEGNPATLHAACPVLRGSKWASNKWIHEIGQELIKPCSI